MKDHEGRLVSIGTVAERLGVSASAIRGWEARGLIPRAIRIEGLDRRVYSTDDLEAIGKVARSRVYPRREEVAAVA